MAKSSKNTTTTKTELPAWLDGDLRNYADAVNALGSRDSSEFVAPANDLQNMAFARAMKLGGAKPTASGTAPSGSSTASAPGVFSSDGNDPYYNPTPARVTGGATGSVTPASSGGGIYDKSGVASNGGIFGKSGVIPSAYAGNPVSDSLEDPTISSPSNVDLAANLFGDDYKDPVSSYIKEQTGFDYFDPAGIFDGLTRKKRTDATDIWGTAKSNAGAAGEYDYAGYVNSTGLKDGYAETIGDTSPQGQKNLHFILSSYDVDGNGALSPGEYGQWWAEQTPEGQSALQHGDFNTPQQAFDQAKAGASQGVFADTSAPTAGGASSAGGSGGAFDTGTDPVDADALFNQAAGLLSDAAGQKATYRTMDQFDPSVYYNPYETEVVDAAGKYYDDQLAQQLAQNKSDATLNGAYGGSRHGVADAELQRTSALDKAQMMANLRYQGYNDAENRFQTDSQGLFGADTFNIQNKEQVANQLTNLASTASQTDINQIAAMLSAGQIQQAIEQAQRTGDITLLGAIGSLLGIGPAAYAGQSTSAVGAGGNKAMAAAGGAATGASVGGWPGAVIGGIGGYLSA